MKRIMNSERNSETSMMHSNAMLERNSWGRSDLCRC